MGWLLNGSKLVFGDFGFGGFNIFDGNIFVWIWDDREILDFDEIV